MWEDIALFRCKGVLLSGEWGGALAGVHFYGLGAAWPLFIRSVSFGGSSLYSLKDIRLCRPYLVRLIVTLFLFRIFMYKIFFCWRLWLRCSLLIDGCLFCLLAMWMLIMRSGLPGYSSTTVRCRAVYDLSSSSGWQQMVTQPTHIDGGVLDLVLTDVHDLVEVWVGLPVGKLNIVPFSSTWCRSNLFITWCICRRSI